MPARTGSPTDTEMAVITRAASSVPGYLFEPARLNPAQHYTVWNRDQPCRIFAVRRELMANGARVPLPTPYSSGVVHIEPERWRQSPSKRDPPGHLNQAREVLLPYRKHAEPRIRIGGVRRPT